MERKTLTQKLKEHLPIFSHDDILLEASSTALTVATEFPAIGVSICLIIFSDDVVSAVECGLPSQQMHEFQIILLGRWRNRLLISELVSDAFEI
jgi:hypothetical protein